MKNKILALTLGTILTLSSTTAFAADLNTTNFNFYEMFRNYNIGYFEPAYTQPVETAQPTEEIKYDYTEQQPANQTPQTEQTMQAVQPTQEEQTAQTAQTKTKNAKTAASPSSNVSYEERVAQLVNIERENNGLQPLVFDSSISNVARAKSKDMADNNYFAHQSPTYGSAGDMMRNFGINWSAWGENIASGQDTPEEVVNGWMHSEGHKANILSSNFGKIGVGYATSSNGTPYWTQMFTN